MKINYFIPSHPHVLQLFWAKTFVCLVWVFVLFLNQVSRCMVFCCYVLCFRTRIPHRSFDECHLSPQFLNSARSRSKVLLKWGDANSNQWNREYNYHWKSKVQEENVSLSIAGLKKNSTEPVGLKTQVLGHGIWASRQMAFWGTKELPSQHLQFQLLLGTWFVSRDTFGATGYPSHTLCFLLLKHVSLEMNI